MSRTAVKAKQDSKEQNGDEPDLRMASTGKNGSRAQSVPPKPRNAFGFSGAKASTASKTGTEAGAVDEEQFRDAFGDYIEVQINSGSQVEAEMAKIKSVLDNPKADWEKRIEQLKRLRGLVIAGGADYKEFQSSMRQVDVALMTAVKDLRSAVVREACVTLAFLAERFGMRFERTAEVTLQSLIPLIPNSAKVMSSSGIVGVRMILTYVHSPKLIPIITQVLVGLKELNPEAFNSMIDTLDDYLREAALKLVNGYPRRPSGLLDEIPRSPAVQHRSPSAKVTPTSRPVWHQNGSAHLTSPSHASGNEENLNPDALFTSIRQTTQKIEKFGYTPKGAVATPASSSATPANRRQQARQQHDTAAFSGTNNMLPTYDDYNVIPIFASPAEQRSYLSSLPERLVAVPKEREYVVLRHLHEYLPLVSEEVWEEQFMTVRAILNEHFQHSQGETTAWALACFAQLFKLQSARMRQFPELTIVSILEVQKGATKLVIKAAEDCGYLAAAIFPASETVKILLPIILGQPHPENAAAVRLFSFVAQQAPKSELIPVLPDIIPPLVTAYTENEESNMRKECVYALIYSQLKVGEDLMAPYLQQLPASKVRLMNLYLKRIVGSGATSSPGEPSSAEKDQPTNTPV